jgi:hypothetical protein
VGLFSTLTALNAFAASCFRDLEPAQDDSSVDKYPGPALILLTVATVAKVFDIWAHFIVPVPETDYWKPGGNDRSSSQVLTA